MFPFSPSAEESIGYYAGLPSHPALVARTGAPWNAPTGPWTCPAAKELRAVGNHALKNIWEDNLALKIHAVLDLMKVKWTSTDVVRIKPVKESFAPVVLWIGVIPASLSEDDGVVVVFKCRETLRENGITDVEVEIRESVVTHSTGPKLLSPPSIFNPTSDFDEPLTTTLGLPICAQSTPWAEGTGGLFVTEGENTERLFLVTARHVVFPPDKEKNELFEHKDSQPRYNVVHFGDAAFNKYIESIRSKARDEEFIIRHHEDRVEAVKGKDDLRANRERKHAQAELDKSKKALPKLKTVYKDVLAHWATPESRVLGHVTLSPPINVGVGSGGYTEDWAVIQIDASKVNVTNFDGNAIDLGAHISPYDFICMMSPGPRNAHSFKYPLDGLLRLKGTIPDEEMRNPTALDENNNPCLMIIKRGNATGLTVGRANDVFSYVRDYNGGGNNKTSKEWAILPFDSKSGAFSEKGDSGSVIVDGIGRVGGLLTSGAGATISSDITYATPISFLLKCMEDKGLHKPNINPVLTV